MRASFDQPGLFSSQAGTQHHLFTAQTPGHRCWRSAGSAGVARQNCCGFWLAPGRVRQMALGRPDQGRPSRPPRLQDVSFPPRECGSSSLMEERSRSRKPTSGRGLSPDRRLAVMENQSVRRWNGPCWMTPELVGGWQADAARIPRKNTNTCPFHCLRGRGLDRHAIQRHRESKNKSKRFTSLFQRRQFVRFFSYSTPVTFAC